MENHKAICFLKNTGLYPPPLENHKVFGFLGNTVPDPFDNHNATQPAFNFGPSKWRFADGPIMARL